MTRNGGLVGVHTLLGRDELKVRGGNGDGDWFPGSGNNYNVTVDGTYQVYFKPNDTYKEGWHYNYFYVAKVS